MPRSALFGCALVYVAACNALTGVSDLFEGDPLADAGGGDAQATVLDASADAAPPLETGATSDAGPPPLCPAAGRGCVSKPPAGWTGPFLVSGGTRMAVPGCPPEWPTVDDEDQGTPTGGIQCAGCKCGAAQNVTCSATLSGYSDSACTVPAALEDPTACRTHGAGPDVSYTASINATGGSCSPSIGTITKDPVTWSNVVRRCSATGAFASSGCADDQLCVPDAPRTVVDSGTVSGNDAGDDAGNDAGDDAGSDAGSKLFQACIRRDGDVSCPGPWTVKLTTNGLDDTRACSTTTCTCDAPTASCTGVLVHYRSKTTCSGSSTLVPIPTTACMARPGGSSQELQPGSLKATGSCVATGTPTATGSVAATTRATICCLP